MDTMKTPDPSKLLLQMGSLFSMDRDHVVKSHRDKVDLSNGLAWTSDNRTMFYNDTLPRKVYAFDFDLNTGTICKTLLYSSFTYSL